MSFFGFGQSADIEIELDGADSRKLVELKQEDGRKDRFYLYYDGETVSGKVNLNLKKSGSRLEHQGIKIEFVGQIELYYDRGNHHEFTSLVKELARPGDLMHNTSYDFEFNQVEKPYESYSGTNVRLRYFLRVTVVRRISDIVREMDLMVHTLSSYPDSNNSIKMEVGIEDCLHIEFEYNKSKYHLKDVIVGKIYFLLVRIKIKHMEIAIMKRETTGSGPNTFNENETIAKYEIMDGAPVRGESIPIRVFLAGYDLTPSMRDINKKFSVRYYLNLVLVDEEERRYFKQQEITLWRKGERVRRPLQEQLLAQQQAMQQLQLGHQQCTVAEPRHQQDSVPPLGAEPPSPHQSQSPMQEEIPSVPNTVTSSAGPLFEQRSGLATPPTDTSYSGISATNNADSSRSSISATNNTDTTTHRRSIGGTNLNQSTAYNNNIISSDSTTAIGVENCSNDIAGDTAASATEDSTVTINTSTMNTEAATLVTSTAAEAFPPLACPSTPPPLPSIPVSPEAAPLVEAANNPPPLPVVPVEDAVADSSDVSGTQLPQSKQVDTEKPASKMNSDIPPLVCPSEPPELPSPPSDPLESPEDEFLEASAASPSPRQQKKEAVAVAQ